MFRDKELRWRKEMARRTKRREQLPKMLAELGASLPAWRENPRDIFVAFPRYLFVITQYLTPEYFMDRYQ